MGYSKNNSYKVYTVDQLIKILKNGAFFKCVWNPGDVEDGGWKSWGIEDHSNGETIFLSKEEVIEIVNKLAGHEPDTSRGLW